MKVKFLVSFVLVFTLMLAACAPKVAATQRSAAPTANPPVTKPTTAPTTSAATSAPEGANVTPTAESSSKSATPNATTSSASKAAGAATPIVGPALINDISIHDQSVQSGTVLVDLVDSLKPGWIAIFTDNNGQPGTVLGYTAVPQGTSTDIQVKIDTSKATSKMLAVLLEDAGTMGTFEYPGADQPVKNANVNTTVMESFNRVGASQ